MNLPHSFADLNERVDEVLVVGGVFVMQGDQTDLEIGGNLHVAGDLLAGKDLF